MKLRRSTALFLAAVMLVSVIQAVPARAAGQTGDRILTERSSVSPETPAVSPENPAATPEGPDEDDTAVVTELDVEYNLDRQVLMMNWSGTNIQYADVYQDGNLIAERNTEGRLVLVTELAEKSEHTYRVVPYNQNGERGAEKSCILKVSDYTAGIDRLTAEYDRTTNRLSVKWNDTYTEYADIFLNGKTLLEHCTEKEVQFICDLQPGAVYTISVLPYNFKEEPGEAGETTVSAGSFAAPNDAAGYLVSVPVLDQAGNQTGFSRPQVQLKWNALAGAVYEIYRAKEDTADAYKWYEDVAAKADGIYTYIDRGAGFGNY